MKKINKDVQQKSERFGLLMFNDTKQLLNISIFQQ